MSNDVTNPSARDPYAAYADELSTRPFDGDLLRFSKHGEYKAGQEQETVEEGVRMIAYLPGVKRGWVKWHEQSPVEHLMGLVAEGFRPPPRDELGDQDESEWETLNDRPMDPWQKTTYLPMCDVDGNLYTFVTASKGGGSAIAALMDAYARRRRMKPDEIPVIELQARSYDHKQYGETFAPVFKIIGWTTVPQTLTELGSAVDQSDETLALEDLMGANGNDAVGHEEDYAEEEPDTAPQRPAPKPAAKPAAKAAPQKPAPQKPAAKAAAAHRTPPKGGKTSSNGRRSVRI